MKTKPPEMLAKIKAWFYLSRPPFHTVGMLPFVLGSFLAWKINGSFDTTIFLLGMLGVVMIMLATYHAGEYFDYVEDDLSKRRFKSRFSGGSGVIPAGVISRQVPFWTSIIALAIAALVGFVLQFVIRTGAYTLVMGALGAFAGFFYSARPIRLVQRGLGEICIGFCYGWLPVASAFYIQADYVHPLIHWIGLPLSMTIMNVILLNEFPDYHADIMAGKRNLLVRHGKTAGVALYMLLSIAAWITLIFSVYAGVPAKALIAYAPVFLLSAFIMVMVLKKKHETPKILEVLCGLNIAVNLGTTVAYLYAFS